MLPLIKILVVFTLIIVMLRKKAGMGATMMASTALLGLLFGMGALDLFKQVAVTLVTLSTVFLIAALVLIAVLESVMRGTGMLKTMTDSLSRLPWNPRIIISAIPAIIGFLPSAGGARFSAPLVDQAAAGTPYRAEDKVFINYWFRHIWEYSLPLYPGLILAAHFSGVALGTILLWQWPVTVIWAVLGYWVVFRRYKSNQNPRQQEGAINSGSGGVTGDQGTPENLLKSLAASTWPLWATVMLVLAHLPIVWSLCLVLAGLIIQKRYPLARVWQTVKDPLTVKIVFLTWGTMAFKDVLQVSGAVVQVSNSIVSAGVPTLLILIALPLVVGVLTGLVQACIGVSFPLVMAMVEPSAGYVMLAYVSGVVGVMISPVHLCLILTAEYFKADFMRSYRPVIVPSLMVVAGTLVLYSFRI
ncbi:MAG: DUF401 family protein [Bacillota bacterium]